MRNDKYTKFITKMHIYYQLDPLSTTLKAVLFLIRRKFTMQDI